MTVAGKKIIFSGFRETVIALAIIGLACPSLFAQNTFQIQNGAQLVCSGNPVISLLNFSQFKNNGTFVPGTGRIVVAGSVVPTVIGSNGGNNLVFYDLDINNTQNVQLAQSIAVSDSIQMVNGNLTLKSNVVTLSSSAGIKNETEASHIVDDPAGKGHIVINQNLGASPYTMPGNLGVEMDASNAALGNTTITRFCTAVVFNGSSAGLIKRYYKIEPSVNAGLNASAKFYYLDQDLNGVDPAVALLWKSTDNGKTWQSVLPDARDNTKKYLLKNNINDFSLWTIGAANSALPIIFNSFNVACNNGAVRLQWSTSADINAGYFLVEKSTDGFTWNSLTRVAASDTASTYHVEDNAGGTAYYRVKEVDKDGYVTYSGILRSDCEGSNSTISIYPNPAGQFTNLEFYSNNTFHGSISIVDAGGKRVRNTAVTIQQGSNLVRVNLTGLAKGIYSINLKSQSVDVSRQLVIR